MSLKTALRTILGNRVYEGVRKIAGGGENQRAFHRLSRVAADVPRYTAGEFDFPFGRFAYADALSLKYQYLEIFLEKGYDFVSDRGAPLIVDCGGNVGLSVVWFKQRYPESRIIVFESDPAIARVLKQNVSALDLKDVQVVPAAVWKETGGVHFASEGADAGRIDDRAAGEVDAVRLADFLTEPVDLLKMDIEGAEYDVLLDLCESGKILNVQRVICELHGRASTMLQMGRLLTALLDSGLRVTFNHARTAQDLPGDSEPTPFPGVPDGKCLLHLFAWRV